MLWATHCACSYSHPFACPFELSSCRVASPEASFRCRASGFTLLFGLDLTCCGAQDDLSRWLRPRYAGRFRRPLPVRTLPCAVLVTFSILLVDAAVPVWRAVSLCAYRVVRSRLLARAPCLRALTGFPKAPCAAFLLPASRAPVQGLTCSRVCLLVRRYHSQLPAAVQQLTSGTARDRAMTEFCLEQVRLALSHVVGAVLPLALHLGNTLSRVAAVYPGAVPFCA